MCCRYAASKIPNCKKSTQTASLATGTSIANTELLSQQPIGDVTMQKRFLIVALSTLHLCLSCVVSQARTKPFLMARESRHMRLAGRSFPFMVMTWDLVGVQAPDTPT